MDSYFPSIKALCSFSQFGVPSLKTIALYICTVFVVVAVVGEKQFFLFVFPFYRNPDFTLPRKVPETSSNPGESLLELALSPGKHSANSNNTFLAIIDLFIHILHDQWCWRMYSRRHVGTIHDCETSHSINVPFGLQFENYFAVWVLSGCFQLNILDYFSSPSSSVIT